MSIVGHLGAKWVPKVLQDTSKCGFFKNLLRFGDQFSKQFQRFCNQIEVPYEKISQEKNKLFNSSLIEEVFRVQEYAFDIANEVDEKSDA